MKPCPHYRPKEPLFGQPCRYWNTKDPALAHCTHPEVMVCSTRGLPAWESNQAT